MNHGGSVLETLGVVSIQGLWESKTEAIIDVRFGDAEKILGIQKEWISCWLGEKKSIKKNMGSTSTKNGNIFLHFPSWLVGLWARRYYLYSPL